MKITLLGVALFLVSGYVHSSYKKNDKAFIKAVEEAYHASTWEAKKAYQKVEGLLKTGANPNITIKEFPLIFYAIQRHDIKIIELLLKYGADPNYKSNGMTPFIFAALPYLFLPPDIFAGMDSARDVFYEERTEIVVLLLKHGADINVLTGKSDIIEKNCTVLDYAVKERDQRLISLLKQHGARSSKQCKL